MNTTHHHPACPMRHGSTACTCHNSRRLADARQLVHFHLVQLLWRLSRSETFWLVLVGLAIAGLLLGLGWGWVL